MAPGRGDERHGGMRLLLVIDLLFWAGAETQLRHLAIGLAEQGHRVTLLAMVDATSHVEDLERAGVELRVLGVKSRLGKILALPRMARMARRADLVHCTGWDASLWGRLAAILARRRVVVTEHTAGREFQVSRVGHSRERLIALHNRVLDPATAATVIVAEAQRELLESEGVRPGSIVRIPNAVPLAELRRRAGGGIDRERLGVPPGAKLVLHAARFTPPKGQPVTLRAVARLRERLGDVRVLFAGAGPEEEKVKGEAEALGADWATFLGSRDDVPALMRSSDLTVLPSKAEGLPMSLIESMAVGTPVVATDVGDSRWLLGTTGGGLCVASGDEEAFTEACGRVLGDDDLRQRLSDAGMTGVAEFDAPRMAERYAELFEVAIASGSFLTLLVCLIPAVLAFLLSLRLRSRSARPGPDADGPGPAGEPAPEPPKRRVLLVINRLFWAGAETQLRNLAIGLAERGETVTLLAVEEIESYREELEQAGVELRELKVHSRLGKVRALGSLYRAAREADVVQCTGWDASLWGRLAAIAARRPVVVAEHSGDRSLQLSRSGAPRARLIALHNRLLDRSTAATVVVSSAQPPQLHAEGVRPESIALIPNGVPVEELRRRARGGCRSALGIPVEAPTLVHVARFIPQKGQATTLRAVAALRERFGDVRAVFAGDGECEAEIKRLAAEMDADWATFLGSRDDVPALLRGADLTVLPSEAEGLPMSLIESMAVGTPVVATDVGDVPWLLQEAGGGLLVPAGDEPAFVAACARLLADPELRGRLGEEGAARAETLDAAHMVERYAAVLEGAIASLPPARLEVDLAPGR